MVSLRFAYAARQVSRVLKPTAKTILFALLAECAIKKIVEKLDDDAVTDSDSKMQNDKDSTDSATTAVAVTRPTRTSRIREILRRVFSLVVSKLDTFLQCHPDLL